MRLLGLREAVEWRPKRWHGFYRRLSLGNRWSSLSTTRMLPRQSLYYLAQMLNVLAMDAPALQIVFAARPALLERLSHPDFETFRNRITLAGGVTEPSLERVQQEGEPVFYPDTRRNKDLEQDNDFEKW